MKPKDLRDQPGFDNEPPQPTRPPKHYGDDRGLSGFDDDGEYGAEPNSGGGAGGGTLFESGTEVEPDEADQSEPVSEEEDEHPEAQ